MPKTTGDEWTIHDYAVGDQIRTGVRRGSDLAVGDEAGTRLARLA